MQPRQRHSLTMANLIQETEPGGSADFSPPDWSAPLDIATWRDETPNGAAIRGMFFRAMLDASGVGHELGRFVPFKKYPATEWQRVAVICAKRIAPGRSVRQGLRELGRHAFPAFADSMVGRVILSVAGRDLEAALRLLPRAYDVAGSMASAELLDVSPGRAQLRLRDCWDFAEAHEVGVFEGVLAAFGKRGQVFVRPISCGDLDLLLVWE